MTENQRSRLLEAVRRDYDAAQRLIDSTVSTVNSSRTLGLTVTSAALAIATQQRVVLLAVIAMALSVLFCVVDAYHSWQYRIGLQHARRLELVLRAAYKAELRAPKNTRDLRNLDRSLRRLRMGTNAQLSGRFRFREFWFTRPSLIFRGLYPALFLASIAVALYAAWPNASETPNYGEPRLVSLALPRLS